MTFVTNWFCGLPDSRSLSRKGRHGFCGEVPKRFTRWETSVEKVLLVWYSEKDSASAGRDTRDFSGDALKKLLVVQGCSTTVEMESIFWLLVPN
jgi:hypothetical protein